MFDHDDLLDAQIDSILTQTYDEDDEILKLANMPFDFGQVDKNEDQPIHGMMDSMPEFPQYLAQAKFGLQPEPEMEAPQEQMTMAQGQAFTEVQNETQPQADNCFDITPEVQCMCPEGQFGYLMQTGAEEL